MPNLDWEWFHKHFNLLFLRINYLTLKSRLEVLWGIDVFLELPRNLGLFLSLKVCRSETTEVFANILPFWFRELFFIDGGRSQWHRLLRKQFYSSRFFFHQFLVCGAVEWIEFDVWLQSDTFSPTCLHPDLWTIPISTTEMVSFGFWYQSHLLVDYEMNFLVMNGAWAGFRTFSFLQNSQS